MTEQPQEPQITSCIKRAGQHARLSHKHCIPCAKHAHAPWPRVNTGLHDFHFLEFSYQPVLSQLHNELKQQCDGAGEPSRMTNYELHGKGWATRVLVVQTLRSVRQHSQFTTPTWQYLIGTVVNDFSIKPTPTSP